MDWPNYLKHYKRSLDFWRILQPSIGGGCTGLGDLLEQAMKEAKEYAEQMRKLHERHAGRGGRQRGQGRAYRRQRDQEWLERMKSLDMCPNTSAFTQSYHLRILQTANKQGDTSQ